MIKKDKKKKKTSSPLTFVKSGVKLLIVLSSFIFLFYLFESSADFPPPPPGAFQSQEPADTETSTRRAYFTDFTREEVLDHYSKQLRHGSFTFLLQRLNYPPEDAQVLIRDQTRSTFLEELTYPMRESLFINGFEPKVAKDDIWYKGVHYRQKITVKYIPNAVPQRLVIAAGIILLSLFLAHEWFSGT